MYLPSSSYEEMGEWSMPAESIHRFHELKERLAGGDVRFAPFVRGGIWQGFFAKYPEANQLHKRGLVVGRRFADLEPRGAAAGEMWGARTELFRSPCNCAYWHGMFGGLYLNNLRHALTTATLAAESQLDQLEGIGRTSLQIAVNDFDADLQDEVAVRNQLYSAIVHPALGGGLSEIAYRPSNYQLTDVLARREEGYHDRLRQLDRERREHPSGGAADGQVLSIHDIALSKGDNLSELLVFDDYRRLCFVDRCHAPAFTLAELRAGQDGERGDLHRLHYRSDAARGNLAADQFGLSLSAGGHVLGQPVVVEKRFAFGSEGFSVSYRLQNEGRESLSFVFAPELNLNLLAGHAPDRYYLLPDGTRLPMDHRGEIDGLKKLQLVEEWGGFALTLQTGSPFQLWCYPIETVSNSEGGFERNFQGSCLLLRTPVALSAGEGRELRFDVGLAKA